MQKNAIGDLGVQVLNIITEVMRTTNAEHTLEARTMSLEHKTHNGLHVMKVLLLRHIIGRIFSALIICINMPL